MVGGRWEGVEEGVGEGMTYQPWVNGTFCADFTLSGLWLATFVLPFSLPLPLPSPLSPSSSLSLCPWSLGFQLCVSSCTLILPKWRFTKWSLKLSLPQCCPALRLSPTDLVPRSPSAASLWWGQSEPRHLQTLLMGRHHLQRQVLTSAFMSSQIRVGSPDRCKLYSLPWERRPLTLAK